MAINSVRTALQLLSGAGELTRAKALEAASTLLELPGVGDTSGRAGQLAEELLQAAAANQQLMHDLVTTEFERQLTRLGLVRGSDLEAAQRRIEVLEAEVAALRRASTSAGGGNDAAAPARASRAAVKRSAADRSNAATKTTPRTAAAKKTTTKSAAAKKTAAKASATPRKAAPKTTTSKTGAARPTATKQTGRGGSK
jgi:hypothetical protein